jgi:hypothetical protein
VFENSTDEGLRHPDLSISVEISLFWAQGLYSRTFGGPMALGALKI